MLTIVISRRWRFAPTATPASRYQAQRGTWPAPSAPRGLHRGSSVAAKADVLPTSGCSSRKAVLPLRFLHSEPRPGQQERSASGRASPSDGTQVALVKIGDAISVGAFRAGWRLVSIRTTRVSGVGAHPWQAARNYRRFIPGNVDFSDSSTSGRSTPPPSVFKGHPTVLTNATPGASILAKPSLTRRDCLIPLPTRQPVKPCGSPGIVRPAPVRKQRAISLTATSRLTR